MNPASPGEECDAGPKNGAHNSGCSTNCTLCGYCGDGIVDDGEQCDLGWKLNGTPGQNCTANCTICDTPPQPKCGDGIVQPGEQCDDGTKNDTPGSKCTTTCTLVCEPKCGNGITEWHEECDDGDLNGTPKSNCTKNCTLVNNCGQPRPPVCGNGVVEGAEECDNGLMNGIPGGNCTKDCHHTYSHSNCTPKCGDGQLDAGEECDDGAQNNGQAWSSCNKTCHKKNPNPGGHCSACNPDPFFNKCTITTSCITTPSTSTYYACRTGYRANGLSVTDPRKFRLEFPGQEYRVFVAPGIDCDNPVHEPASWS
ncbi:hypothetical protein B0H63DRAFT_529636 [Podospora didyma]|uniref:Uncharacterized protein n=1 Tax=Podospora didyma TaxID=330526 RepID=A0AAE0N248_9PEZI|nr:hypothetical protein B0H63DRAFT_529636 [Podospora didyma]